MTQHARFQEIQSPAVMGIVQDMEEYIKKPPAALLHGVEAVKPD